jgi:hypothetical protein
MDETVQLVKLLLAALEDLEWIEGGWDYDECPSCHKMWPLRGKQPPHDDNCQLQAAIAAARSWLLRNERAEYSQPVAAELAAHGGPVYVTEISGVPTGDY